MAPTQWQEIMSNLTARASEMTNDPDVRDVLVALNVAAYFENSADGAMEFLDISDYCAHFQKPIYQLDSKRKSRVFVALDTMLEYTENPDDMTNVNRIRSMLGTDA